MSDDAQIVSIDGIDVVGKSHNYVRTLLATKERPLAIKFKNDVTSIPIANVTINTKKRNRSQFSQKKRADPNIQVPKLHLATPNRKRKRDNSCTLSPVLDVKVAADAQADEMDVDSTTDTELR